ncbi:MAG: glycosyltransferase [Gammaproteobacteria bacterium]|nr:glycosyltransferase [Gammaproteobacteria bacterium]
MKIDYSLIIPAYNEENWLADTIVTLKKTMSEMDWMGELIVVDNNSTDGTAEVAKQYGATLVFEAINQISRARNAGAAVASGRYLVFVDADTHIPSALLQQALTRLESGNCIGGGTTVEFDIPLARITALGLAGWNWLSVKLGLAAGCFIFCRRDAFDKIGGFSEKVYASEEIWLSRKLKKLGRIQQRRFCIIEHHPAISSGRKLHWYSFGQQLVMLLIMILFPFFVRFKSLCGFWYKRPDNH